MIYRLCQSIILSVCSLASVRATELPDLRTVPTDLTPPAMVEDAPAAGKRVKMVAEEYQGTDVYHCLYLPTNWKAGNSYPVIVEYAGNGPYRNKFGDTCTGKVEDCNLGYGISGGKDFIWICLPYINGDLRENQLRWWGDVDATVAYCKAVVPAICQEYGGDPRSVLLAGFSRGAIACNFIGLHNDQIASLWRGFVCHSHYDGVRAWDYSEPAGQSAMLRLGRLAGRPQFISHEGSIEETREYLTKVCGEGDFTFQALPYRNHTDTWVLRDLAERDLLRAWVKNILTK